MVIKICRVFILFLIRALVFRRVSLLGAPLPDKGAPVLYLGFHRNGAVDGWAYTFALSRPVEFMVASNLLRNPIVKLFFWGVEVTRRGDEGSPASNRRGLDAAVAILARGGSLFIFPEGTSTLGHKHLEFMKGAALVASRAFKQNPGLMIVPLSIRYPSPALWGGDAEVTAGQALSFTDFENPLDAKELHRTFTDALESLAPGFSSENEMEDACQMASLADFAAEGIGKQNPVMPYSIALNLAAGVSGTVAGELWRAYKQGSSACKKWRGVAVFPDGSAWLEGAKFTLSAAAVLSALLFNFIPAAAGAWAGRRFPDGPNVILLWKSLVGLSVLLVYTPALWCVFFAAGHGWLAAVHLCVTALGCKCAERYRKSGASLWNFLFHRHLRPKYEHVKEALRDEFMARFSDS